MNNLDSIIDLVYLILFNFFSRSPALEVHVHFSKALKLEHSEVWGTCTTVHALKTKLNAKLTTMENSKVKKQS